MSLTVDGYVDLDTHGMFICHVNEARVISDKETMTYTYYQNNVKPKPKTEGKKVTFVKFAVTFTRAKNFPKILSVRFANTALRILSQ